jgi:putative DNA primase/helicase
MSPDIAKLMEPVARALLGEPNTNLSAKGRLRFGSRGSVVVSLEDGTYYDHENQVGGGVLHLVERMTGQANGAAVAWIKETLDVDIGPQPEHQPRRLIATYDYMGPDGALMFQVCRYQPRDFRQRRPDDRGGWIWNLKDIEPVPYRLPALADADTVFIPEGEKDCDNLAALGLTATTNPGGAGKWRPGYARYLRGKNIIVLPDNDRVGREHAQAVAASLTSVAASVTILELPGLPAKGDVSDWIAEGGTAEKRMALAASAAARPMQEEKQRPADPIDQIVADLAELDPIGYDRRRKAEAKRLGIRASALDRAVEDARGDEPETGQGRSLDWPEPDPWPEPVVGAELL